MAGFSIVFVTPVALVISLVGLFWKESRWLSAVGLLLSGVPVVLFIVIMVIRASL